MVNTYEKPRGEGVLWLTRHATKRACPQGAWRLKDLSLYPTRIFVLSERSESTAGSDPVRKNLFCPWHEWNS